MTPRDASIKSALHALLACALFVVPSVGLPADYRLQTIAEGLDHPWCIAFLPDGGMLITERSGQLRVLRNGALRTAPVTGVPPVYARSQGGLFDILLHPDFSRNGIVFLSYAHGHGRANATRVARAVLENDTLTALEVIFEVTPAKDTPVHYGGRMAFLPDGTLLVTTGDGFDYREAAQSLDGLLGKTIRITETGDIPADNPFVGVEGARPEIWTYGHRNPQGIAVDTASGVIYLHEHGARGGDELNSLTAGANYGWPVIAYGVDYSGAYITPLKERDGMEQPIVYWDPSIAPAGMAYYDGAMFPEWQGDLFVAALVERSVRRLDMEEGGVAGQETLFTELDARIRDVRAGPDGALYLLTDSDDGEVVRVIR